jgi:hypothetical protein
MRSTAAQPAQTVRAVVISNGSSSCSSPAAAFPSSTRSSPLTDHSGRTEALGPDVGGLIAKLPQRVRDRRDKGRRPAHVCERSFARFAERLPEPRLVTVEQPETPHPLGALPEVEVRRDEAAGPPCSGSTRAPSNPYAIQALAPVRSSIGRFVL